MVPYLPIGRLCWLGPANEESEGKAFVVVSLEPELVGPPGTAVIVGLAENCPHAAGSGDAPFIAGARWVPQKYTRQAGVALSHRQSRGSRRLTFMYLQCEASDCHRR